MTPLVLLPGMMCDARLFGPQIAALDGRDVLVPALDGADDMGTLAAQVLAASPERFALAGLSMGGIVAMEVIRQAPQRVERLALLDTNPRAETPAVQARRAPQIAAAKAGRLHEVMRDEMKPNYLADGPGRQDVLDLCMAMAMDLGPDVFVRQSVALRDRPDQQETLRGVTVPTLILCGAEDALCPVERHELMHGLIPGSTLTIIDGAGHLPTLETPDETNAALRRWLEAA
ncbi:alpha/beta fold hydrolase [Wenxinia saemankumensis]|uniref:Pimeloyl-ACP methyl ester carboxylesterase n=1 Tax=Wenxinia saemankumensis TaxID=1447782 RepID=A0A1M6HXX2_9RHOB|nr:alpha/beta fold hydrolase [Wenxinia saemankumensis]SHJ27055.1 Pimeloyl-ACP methyl ester carboxylesterase [Wenxinia saemankumensis]